MRAGRSLGAIRRQGRSSRDVFDCLDQIGRAFGPEVGWFVAQLVNQIGQLLSDLYLRNLAFVDWLEDQDRDHIGISAIARSPACEFSVGFRDNLVTRLFPAGPRQPDRAVQKWCKPGLPAMSNSESIGLK